MPAMPRKAPLTVVTLKNGPLSNRATDFLLMMETMLIIIAVASKFYNREIRVPGGLKMIDFTSLV